VDDDEPVSLLFLLQFSLQEGAVDRPEYLYAEVVLADEHAHHIAEFLLVSRLLFRQGFQQLHGGFRVGLKVLFKTEGVGRFVVGARILGD
jgi:hypothetical protein